MTQVCPKMFTCGTRGFFIYLHAEPPKTTSRSFGFGLIHLDSNRDSHQSCLNISGCFDLNRRPEVGFLSLNSEVMINDLGLSTSPSPKHDSSPLYVKSHQIEAIFHIHQVETEFQLPRFSNSLEENVISNIST